VTGRGCSAEAVTGEMTGETTAATGEMTGATGAMTGKTTAAAGAMTGKTGVAAGLGCSGSPSARRSSVPVAPSSGFAWQGRTM
jgi:hypothetical protein